MKLVYHTLDVFTDRVFGGNPLAVFPEVPMRERPAPDGSWLSDATMQQIARELNLSETVFVTGRDAHDGARFSVRIFTPGYEVPFAGHPTVGTAFLLVALGMVDCTPGQRSIVVTLDEKVGPVPVEVELEPRAGAPRQSTGLDAGLTPIRATLTAAEPPSEMDPAMLGLERDAIARMLSLDPDEIGCEGLEAPHLTTELEPAFASVGLPFLIVPVRNVAVLGRAHIDSAAWAAALPEGSWSRMVCVVAPGAGAVGGGRVEGGPDLQVRTFCPDAGVPEDPATGSANAALAGYLARRSAALALWVMQGAEGGGAGTASAETLRWSVAQGVEMGRPSALELEAEVSGGGITAVRVGGAAVVVSRCEMEIPFA